MPFRQPSGHFVLSHPFRRTTELHCMQKQAVETSKSAGSTARRFIVSLLPQASKFSSASLMTCTVPVSLWDTKENSSTISDGMIACSLLIEATWISGGSSSWNSDSPDSEGCSPSSSRSTNTFNRSALLTSGLRMPSFICFITWETFLCRSNWESLL